MQRQALGETNATAGNRTTTGSVLGRTESRKKDGHPHGQQRAAEPSSADAVGQAEALPPLGQSGTILPHGNHATPFKTPSQEGTKCHNDNKLNKEKNSQGKQKKNKKPKQLQTLESMVGPVSESWTRFHVLHMNDDNENDSSDNVGIWTELQSHLDPGFTCIRRRDGSILIDAKTEKNSEKLEKIKRLCNRSISTTRDEETNTSTGTVLVPRSEFRNPEGLAERILHQAKLQDLPASKAEHYTLRSARTQKELHFVKLTFETRTLPTYMYVGFE